MRTNMGKQSASHDRSGVAPLRALLEVTRLVGSEVDVHALLEAVAETISETLGFRTVAINLYRPAWDDFCVTTVHGSRAAQDALLGRVRDLADWERLLDDRFLRRGAYVIEHGSVDWDAVGVTYVPDLEPPAAPDGWHPEDALFVPMRHSDGHLLGILSVDEPKSGLRAGD
jgi:transcriptional regulator with GAF, ATPase, and Fis domain